MAQRKTSKSSKTRRPVPARGWFYGGVLAATGFCAGMAVASLFDTPRLVVHWMRGPVASVELDAPAPALGANALEQYAELQADETRSVEAPPRPRPRPAGRAERSAPERAQAPRRSTSPPSAQNRGAAALIKDLHRDVASRADLAEGELVVQVAAPLELTEALQIDRRLRAQGFDSFLATARPEGVQRHRVRVRPAQGQKIRELAASLRKRGFSTWITAE